MFLGCRKLAESFENKCLRDNTKKLQKIGLTGIVLNKTNIRVMKRDNNRSRKLRKTYSKLLQKITLRLL